MAQVHAFYLLTVPGGDDLLCELLTLESAMEEVTTLIGQQEMHRYFPVKVVVEDTEGRQTHVCTVSL